MCGLRPPACVPAAAFSLTCASFFCDRPELTILSTKQESVMACRFMQLHDG